jgi:hypothetical protein
VGNSLQDQLLKAGLVDKGRIEKAKKQQKTKARRQRNVKAGAAPGQDPEREKEQAEKAARDRELNRQINEAQRQRELAAQIKQLVVKHRVPRSDSEDDRPFYFENKGKVKRLYVSARTHGMITTGKLAIVNHNGVFELVPRDVAEKIRQRNPSLVIDLPEERQPDEADPYAAYQVPDDLMW